MARSEDRKPMMPRIPKARGMDAEAGAERAEKFRAMTQGRGKQMVFGSGDPSKVPAKPKAKK